MALGVHRRPWEAIGGGGETRHRHEQTEILVAETTEGHRRWSSDEGPEFLSKFALYFASNIDKAGGHGRPWEVEVPTLGFVKSMGGGGVVEVVEVVEVYLPNQYTRHPSLRHIRNPYCIKKTI